MAYGGNTEHTLTEHFCFTYTFKKVDLFGFGLKRINEIIISRHSRQKLLFQTYDLQICDQLRPSFSKLSEHSDKVGILSDNVRENLGHWQRMALNKM